jgi:hypothetical protein
MSDSPKALKNMFSSMALPSKTILSISCVYHTIFQNFEAEAGDPSNKPLEYRGAHKAQDQKTEDRQFGGLRIQNSLRRLRRQ